MQATRCNLPPIGPSGSTPTWKGVVAHQLVCDSVIGLIYNLTKIALDYWSVLLIEVFC